MVKFPSDMVLIISASSETSANPSLAGTISARDQFGQTVLHIAAAEGYSEIVQAVLARGADKSLKSGGNNALHIAASHGHLPVVQDLIKNGADVNARGWAGMTALHLAALRGYADVAQCLISAKADINAENSQGETPIFFTVRNSVSPEVRDRVGGPGVQAKATSRLSMDVVTSGQEKVFYALLGSGAKINVRTKIDPIGGGWSWPAEAGRTVLYEAVLNEHFAMMKALIANGAELKTSGGSPTPLHAAATLRNPRFLRKLIEAGANPSAIDSNGRMPWECAMFDAEAETTIELLTSGDIDTLLTGIETGIKGEAGEKAPDGGESIVQPDGAVGFVIYRMYQVVTETERKQISKKNPHVKLITKLNRSD